MTLGGEGIRVPHLSYDSIGEFAEAFLAKHNPSRAIPVPIEEIIDVQLHIDIVPVPGLTAVFSEEEDDGVESFVNSSLDQIFVDRRAYDRQTNRYRFSIAHELGHILLHKEAFSRLKADSIAEWKKTIRSIPAEEYAWLEWQAYSFAGHVLVPTRELSDNLHNLIDRVKEENFDPTEDAVRLFLEKRLADVFSVSSDVIHRRIDKQGLWR